MRTLIQLMLITFSISLTACSSMTGNVIPNKGPTMEQVYDSMGGNKSKANSSDSLENSTSLHKYLTAKTSVNTASFPALVNYSAVSQEFHKLANPELHLYVFPHLAGKDQIPVPGYYTAFNVYEHDHYALPQETARG